MKLREFQGKVVDSDLMYKCKERAETKQEFIETIEEAKEWVEKAKFPQTEVIKKQKGIKEERII